jgi:hypothetical protein
MIKRCKHVSSVSQKGISDERLSSLGNRELDEFRNGMLNIVEAWEEALKAAPKQPLRQRERERQLNAIREIMLKVLAESARRQAANS